MNYPGSTYGSVGKRSRRFLGGLLIFKGLISRLVNLVSVTQQDLMEAGVFLRQTGERD